MRRFIRRPFIQRALTIGLLTLAVDYAAAEGIGDFTGTATPQVVTPQSTPAPPPPEYPPAPVGSAVPIGPPVTGHGPYRQTAPRIVAPARPPG